MRKLLTNKHGDMNMVITAIIIAVMLAIGLVVVFEVFGGIAGDASTIDQQIQENDGEGAGSWHHNKTTPTFNTTEALRTNIETFYSIAPIMLIVVAAVGILGYVMLLRKR